MASNCAIGTLLGFALTLPRRLAAAVAALSGMVSTDLLLLPWNSIATVRMEGFITEAPYQNLKRRRIKMEEKRKKLVKQSVE
jgi:hypothetical protein